jgi:tight adherence protein C
MTPEALLLGLALGCGLWMVISLLIPAPKPSLAQRIAPYLLDVSAEAREIHYGPERNPLVIAGIVLSPMLHTYAKRVDAVLGGRDSQRIVFGRSGRLEEFEDYRVRRAVFVGTAAAAGGLFGAALSLGSSIPGGASVLGGILVASLVTLGAHDAALSRQAARRSERIREEFPTLLELLGLSLAAGDSLPRALFRVSRRAQGELGREWARVMDEVEGGAMLGSALRDSALRMGSPAVAAFVEHLAQALDRGAPLAEVIQAHGSDAQADYSRSLVDKAGTAEVQMLVPMVLLILPITVIFAVYPGLQALEFGF